MKCKFETILSRLEGSGPVFSYIDITECRDSGIRKYSWKNVKGTINGVAFRSMAVSREDGSFIVPLDSGIEGLAGAAPGATVSVEIEEDAEERVLKIPEDFSLAMTASSAVLENWEVLPYSRQVEILLWISEAEKKELRRRRIEQVLGTLTEQSAMKAGGPDSV